MKLKTRSASKYLFAIAGAFILSGAVSAQALTPSVDIKINGDTGVVNTSANASVDTSVGKIIYSTTTVDSKTETTSSSEVSSAEDTSSDTQVEVTYKRPAKLFGFISVYVNEKATVKAEKDGSTEVKVRKSWWSFLAKSETRSEEFSSAIKSRVSSDVDISAEGELSASSKAKLVADIKAAAEATY